MYICVVGRRDFLIFFKILVGLETQHYKAGETDLPSTFFLLRCLQWLGMGQAKTGSQEPQGVTHVNGRGPNSWAVF